MKVLKEAYNTKEKLKKINAPDFTKFTQKDIKTLLQQEIEFFFKEV